MGSKVFASLLASFVISASVFSQPLFGSTSSLEWMAVDSSLIVRGQIESIEVQKVSPTVFHVTFRVTETLKGPNQNEIKFVLPAKTYPADGVLAAWADEKKELLVFLRESQFVRMRSKQDYTEFPYGPRSGWRDESILLLDADAEVQVMSESIEPLSDPEEILKRTRAAVEATKTGAYHATRVRPPRALVTIPRFKGYGGVSVGIPIPPIGKPSAFSIRGSRLTENWDFDGKRLLGTIGKDVYLWDAESGQLVQKFVGHDVTVRAASISPDGKTVLTGSGGEQPMAPTSSDNTARIWDVATGEEIQRFEGHAGYVLAARFNRDGDRILTVGSDNIRLWKADTGQVLSVFDNIQYLQPDSTFSLSGAKIIGRTAIKVLVWDTKTGREVCAIDLDYGRGYSESAVLSQDGKHVLTATAGGSVRAWDADTGAEVQKFVGHRKYVFHALFRRTGSEVVSGSNDGTVRVWDFTTGNEIRVLKNPGSVHQLLISPDGRWCFAKWREGVISSIVTAGAVLWDLDSGREILRLNEMEAYGLMGFAPDSKTFFMLGGPVWTQDGKTAYVRSSENGSIVHEFGLEFHTRSDRASD